MEEYRCPTCNKLQFKGSIASPSHIERKCKCGHMVVVEVAQGLKSATELEPDGLGGYTTLAIR